jgi:hypothetical protein
MEAPFHGRKSYPAQNVMAVIDFDLQFTFVVAGWEGTTHNALILQDAQERPNGLHVPEGKIKFVCLFVITITWPNQKVGP